MNREIRCTLVKFADNSKLSGVADMPEGWDSIQAGWGSEQPDLGEDIPVHCSGAGLSDL